MHVCIFTLMDANKSVLALTVKIIKSKYLIISYNCCDKPNCICLYSLYWDTSMQKQVSIEE